MGSKEHDAVLVMRSHAASGKLLEPPRTYLGQKSLCNPAKGAVGYTQRVEELPVLNRGESSDASSADLAEDDLLTVAVEVAPHSPPGNAAPGRVHKNVLKCRVSDTEPVYGKEKATRQRAKYADHLSRLQGRVEDGLEQYTRAMQSRNATEHELPTRAHAELNASRLNRLHVDTDDPILADVHRPQQKPLGSPTRMRVASGSVSSSDHEKRDFAVEDARGSDDEDVGEEEFTSSQLNQPSLDAVSGGALETGRWSSAEHARFINGLELYGRRKWQKIAELVGTRTTVQVRSHAQKYFKKIRKEQEAAPQVGAPPRVKYVEHPTPSLPESKVGKSTTVTPKDECTQKQELKWLLAVARNSNGNVDRLHTLQPVDVRGSTLPGLSPPATSTFGPQRTQPLHISSHKQNHRIGNSTEGYIPGGPHRRDHISVKVEPATMKEQDTAPPSSIQRRSCPSSSSSNVLKRTHCDSTFVQQQIRRAHEDSPGCLEPPARALANFGSARDDSHLLSTVAKPSDISNHGLSPQSREDFSPSTPNGSTGELRKRRRTLDDLCAVASLMLSDTTTGEGGRPSFDSRPSRNHRATLESLDSPATTLGRDDAYELLPPVDFSTKNRNSRASSNYTRSGAARRHYYVPAQVGSRDFYPGGHGCVQSLPQELKLPVAYRTKPFVRG